MPGPDLLAPLGSVGGQDEPAADVVLTLLSLPDGQEPVPSGDNHQYFEWGIDGSVGQVVAELAELSIEGGDWYLLPADKTRNVSSGRIGNSRFNSTVRWRAWALLHDGRIAFSSTRSYGSF